MSSPSLGWERLNEVFYRSRELYQHSSAITAPSSPLHLAVAKYSKAIATYQNQLISVHQGNGLLINSINWNHHINGKIIGLDWTINEELVVIIANGIIRVYFDFEADFNEYQLGYDSVLVGILDYKIVDSVIFVILNDFKIIYIDLKSDNKFANIYRDLSNELQGVEFHTWDIYKDFDYNVLISVDSIVYHVPKYGKLHEKSMDGPFKNLVISPNNEFIMLYKESISKVFVITCSFIKNLFEITVPANPDQINWCGSDAVILKYQDYLKLVAPGGSIDFFNTNEIIKISTEIDGLTVLTDSTLEFLNKIDLSTIDCFKIGSTTNASILIDSIDKLNKHSPKANENLKIIGDLKNLENAVRICLKASLEEFDPYWQKKLLRASSFGKSDIELKSTSPSSQLSSDFIKTCDDLRILNNVRNLGIFLTFNEYKQLGIEKVIGLLIKRQLFQESFEISRFLKLPIDSIFISWCCIKIKLNPNLSDEELSQQIISKFQSLSDNSYISFEKISNVAFEEGRINLSKILINFEIFLSKQIPILLKMEENELALLKAVESQDIDLILLTLLKLKSKLSLPNFFKIVDKSKASSFFEWGFKSDRDLMYDYYNQDDRLLDITNFQLYKAFNENDDSLDIDEINNKQLKVLSDSIDTYSLLFNKNSNDLHLLQSQRSLVKFQMEMTSELNINFGNLSTLETLQKLIELGQTTRIEKFKKTFKITEVKYQYLKFNTFIASHKFQEIHDWLITETSLKINNQYIVSSLMNTNELKLLGKLVKLVKNPLKLSNDEKERILDELKKRGIQ